VEKGKKGAAKRRGGGGNRYHTVKDQVWERSERRNRGLNLTEGKKKKKGGKGRRGNKSPLKGTHRDQDTENANRGKSRGKRGAN